MARAGAAGLRDFLDAQRLDWDDHIAALAAEVRDLTPLPRTAKGAPRWDAKAGCWVTSSPTGYKGSPKAREATQRASDERLRVWMDLREHPLFGSLVRPAREAQGGWIEDDGEFWRLVETETAMIRKAMLAERWGARTGAR